MLKKIFMAIAVMTIAPASIVTNRRVQAKPSEKEALSAKCKAQYMILEDGVKEARREARRYKGVSERVGCAEVTPLLEAYREKGVYPSLTNWAAVQGKNWENLDLQERIAALNEWTAACRPGFNKD